MATWRYKFETDVKLDLAFIALKSLFTDGTTKSCHLYWIITPPK